MKSLTEVLREYLASGGSREVYDAAKKEFAALRASHTELIEALEALLERRVSSIPKAGAALIRAKEINQKA
jgi:hypothetical protein